MKRLAVILAAVGALLTAVQAHGKTSDNDIDWISLDPYEHSALLYWHEMQKFVHDANAWANECYPTDLFRNLAAAERSHLAAFDDIDFSQQLSDETGVFIDPGLQQMWNDYAFPCWANLRWNLERMGYLEEYEIRGMHEAIAGTDEPPLQRLYTNLLAGERNHLRMLVSFMAQLGFGYGPQILEPQHYQQIVGDLDLAPGEAFAMNPGLNDAWYYPGTDGQGFFVTLYPDAGTVFLSWFTFDTQAPPQGSAALVGHPCQKWLTAQGQFSGGQAELQIYSSRGGIFDTGAPAPVLDRVGSVLLQFDDCASGSVFYDLPFAERTGLVPIQRLAPDNVALCEQLQAASD